MAGSATRGGTGAAASWAVPAARAALVHSRVGGWQCIPRNRSRCHFLACKGRQESRNECAAAREASAAGYITFGSCWGRRAAEAQSRHGP